MSKLSFNKRNIYLIEPLFFDSEINAEFLINNFENGISKFNIVRPFWEKPEITSLFFLNRVRVRRINSEVVVNDILNFSLEYNKNTPEIPLNEIYSIIEINFDDSQNKLEFDTGYFNLSIILSPDFDITITDIGNPGSFLLNIIKFKKATFDFEKWKESVEKNY